MKIFVTGGAGYIGSVCVETLLDAGHEVVVWDNLTEGHRSAVDSRANFLEGDLAQGPALTRALADSGASAVFHFAAKALVGESMQHPERYFGNNVVGGLNLLEACREAGVKQFVFSSTCATYGPPDRLPITEDLPQHPINPYGDSKLMFEKMLRWYGQIHGLKSTVFRYFNAAGASRQFGEHHRIETHLIPNVLAVALGQRSHCDLFGTDYETPDGTCIRDYLHIRDIAQAHLKALETGVAGFFNLGNGEGYSVKQVVDCCREITGHEIPIQVKPRRPGDPPRLVAAADRAMAELGWKPEYPDLRSMVETAWAWHRAHPDGYPD